MTPETAVLRTGVQVPMEVVHATIGGLASLAAMNHEAFEELARSVRDESYEITDEAVLAASAEGLLQERELEQDVRDVILAATSERPWGFKIIPCLDYDAMGLNRKRD